MCLSPLHIFNNSERLGRFSHIFYDVPCGHCDECLNNKVLDYSLRCECEYNDCLDNGGYAFFDTLTYNDDNLPHLGKIPCFSRPDISAFFKRLRTNLEYRLNFPLYEKGVRKLSWFLVSEYGTNFGRPHYHVIFFVKDPRIDVKVLKLCIRKSWYKGFVDPIFMMNKHVLTSPAAIRYICKYVNKIQDWESIYKTELLNDLENRLSNQSCEFESIIDTPLKNFLPDYAKKNSLACIEFLYTFRKIRPFIIASQSLGLNWLTDNFDVDNATIKITSPDGPKIVPISRYYLYKIYYTLTKENGKYRFKLNNLGKNLKMSVLIDSIEAKVNKYQNILANSSLDILFNVNNLLGNRTLYDVVVYETIFKDCHFDLVDADIDLNTYFDDPFKFFIQSKFPTDTFVSKLYDSDPIIRTNERNRLGAAIISESMYHYSDFDKILNIIHILKIKNKTKFYESKKMKSNIKNKIHG